MVHWAGTDAVHENELYSGVVVAILDTNYMIALSPYVIARLSILDISSQVDVVKNFKENCFIGLRVVVAVTYISSSAHRASCNRLMIENAASGQCNVDLSNSLKIESIPNSIKTPVYNSGQEIFGIIRIFGSRKVSKSKKK